VTPVHSEIGCYLRADVSEHVRRLPDVGLCGVSGFYERPWTVMALGVGSSLRTDRTRVWMSSRIPRAYFWSGLAKVLDVRRRLIIATGLDIGSVERQKPKEVEIA
jgi:hypothetical protein